MTLPKFFSISCLSLALMACGQSNVSAAPASKSTSSTAKLEQVKKSVEMAYQEQKLKVVSIEDSPVAGWYEVVVPGNQIIYVNESAEYMMVGDLINMKDKKSLTEERSKDLNRIDYAKLPLDKAIKEVRGNGKLQVVVFSDPECPYCRKLENEFEKMTDITIYTFLMPITSLHPSAVELSEQLWCQPDRAKAWTEWMRKGTKPLQVSKCANPVQETMVLGESMGFVGTPTLIFPNGRSQSGYAPKAQLEEAIKNNQAK